MRAPLFFDEAPVLIRPSLAVAIGLNEAVILHQIHFWLSVKRADKDDRTFKDGYFWVYNTYAEWQEQFPWWSIDTIKRTIQHLETLGLLLSTDRYNQQRTDRTKWYRIDYDAVATFEATEQPAPLDECNPHSSEEGNLHPSGAMQSAPIIEQGNLHRSVPESPDRDTAESQPEKGHATAVAPEQPFAILSECLLIMGQQPNVLGAAKNKQLAVIKRLLAAGTTPDQIIDCVEWLWGQEFFRRTGVDMFTVDKHLPRYLTADHSLPSTPTPQRFESRRDRWERDRQANLDSIFRVAFGGGSAHD